MKKPGRLTMKQLLESGLVSWTHRKTVEKKCKLEGFPHTRSGDGPKARFEFDPKEVELWFKKREVKAS